ncbi:glycoside hydrolase family 27 protein [Paucibacter soli]|uniref:glycoside hydrolase family 27 protein n=1 Tax=Paucibacter soli TaxID=3133433 RepID=UPI0030A57EE2
MPKPVFKHWCSALLLSLHGTLLAQSALAPLPASTPPMGWMSWNLLGDQVNERDLKAMADAMIASGMRKAGYDHLFIDDGWQGGRDETKQLIADPKKFPSGIKALADYLHARGLKLGIYSDAAPLTCAGYMGSLGFEDQDAKTFADWGVDFLKYDYCNAPPGTATAVARYRRMGEALANSGRTILYSICEWGDRQPWKWAAEVGGHLWRTTADIRDKWKKLPQESSGVGILDVYDINVELQSYAAPGRWNDADMLVVGLRGHAGPAALLGGAGASDIEYQSQFALWAMMHSPLYASNDLRRMSAATLRILGNTEVIALNQDPLGKAAVRVIHAPPWDVLVKPLANGDTAVAILNRADQAAAYSLPFEALGIQGAVPVRDLHAHKDLGRMAQWRGTLAGHETKLLRLRAAPRG